MIAYRRWVTAAGLAWIAALLLSACGGGDEAAEPPGSDASDAVAPKTPGQDDARVLDEAALRAKAYADMPEGQRPIVEEITEGEYRYSGRTENGELFNAQLGGEVKVPPGFPQEIPMYPDSVTFSAMDTEGGVSMVTIDASDDEATVYEYYQEKLPASGWTVDNEVNVGTGRILKASKGDLEAIVHVQEFEGGSRVGFSVGPKS